MRIHPALRTLIPTCLVFLSLLVTLYVNAGPIPGVRDPRMERMLRNAVNKPVGWVDASDFAKINRLDIFLPADLHGLENCTALEELSLSAYLSVDDPENPGSQIAPATDWRRWMAKPIQFKYRVLEDLPDEQPSLEPLSRLPKLKSLAMDGPIDMDINELRHLQRLERLSVDTGYFDVPWVVVDWTGLAQSKTISNLTLRIGYDSVPSLTAAPNLTTLWLDRNLPYDVPLDGYAVVDYSNLWNAQSLRTLTVNDRACTKWNVTGQPLNLSTLSLTGEWFSSFDGIATAVNLDQLAIRGGAIFDLEEVAKLPSLHDLQLWSVEPVDLAPLAHSPSLRNLELINLSNDDYPTLLALCDRNPMQQLHLYIDLGGGTLPQKFTQPLDASNIRIHDSSKDYLDIRAGY